MNTRSRAATETNMSSIAIEMDGNTNLADLSNDQLINMATSLRRRNKELEEKVDKRLEILERVQNSSLQYLRRDTVEISGIPADIPQSCLEDEVIKVIDTAGVTVEERKLDKLQIHACHRIGTKGVAIVKTVNRKLAKQLCT